MAQNNDAIYISIWFGYNLQENFIWKWNFTLYCPHLLYTIICEYACLGSVTRGMSSDGFIIIDSLYDFNAMKTVCVLETLSGCPEGLC